MTEQEFQVLYERLKASGGAVCAEATHNEDVVCQLIESGYLDSEQQVTEKGIDALRPYKVRNAVILAAGMSTRFVPYSYEKPKGLMVCRGEVLIERQIRQLQEAGVPEIVVVVGYMKEKYKYLEDQFGVVLVENDDYVDRNNNGSIFAARDYLGNSYICASDNYFAYNVFEPYVYRSFYDSVYAAGPVDERGLFLDDEGRIVKTERPTSDRWLMFGKAYLDKAFSEKLLGFIEEGYHDPVLKTYLWEWIYNLHIEEFDLYAKKYPNDTILEFDSLDDLRLFDDYYIDHSGSSILDRCCSCLRCEPREISNIKPVKDRREQEAFFFDYQSCRYMFTKDNGVERVDEL